MTNAVKVTAAQSSSSQLATGPSGEEQAPLPLPGGDLLTLVAQEHQRLLGTVHSLQQRSESDPTDPHARLRLCHQLLADLSQHLVATCWCLHAPLRALGTQARSLAQEQNDLATRMHQVMRCCHQNISGDMLAARCSFPQLLAQLDRSLERHARAEEEQVVPTLREALGEEGTARVGQRLVAVLPSCPTRAHPNLSFQSRWTPATARLAAAWDHVQDVVDNR